jgi:hypothetical protein
MDAFYMHHPTTVEPPRQVSEFLDFSTARWNEEKLRHHMLPMNVDEILQIPICLRQHADFWSWHYDRRGVFTVRSAYKMLVSTEDTERHGWRAELVHRMSR